MRFSDDVVTVNICCQCADPIDNLDHVNFEVITGEDTSVAIDLCNKCISYLWWSLDKANRLPKHLSGHES